MRRTLFITDFITAAVFVDRYCSLGQYGKAFEEM